MISVLHVYHPFHPTTIFSYISPKGVVISGRGKGGGGGVCSTKRDGGQVQSYPYKKGGGGGGTEQVLAMLSGGTTGFGVALTMDLEVVATLILMGGGGGNTFSPFQLKGWGAKGFTVSRGVGGGGRKFFSFSHFVARPPWSCQRCILCSCEGRTCFL